MKPCLTGPTNLVLPVPLCFHSRCLKTNMNRKSTEELVKQEGGRKMRRNMHIGMNEVNHYG